MFSSGWSLKLLFCECSRSVRSLAAKLVTQLCDGDSHPGKIHCLSFSDLILPHFENALSNFSIANDMLALVATLISDDLVRLYLVRKGLLRMICAQLDSQVQRIMSQQNASSQTVLSQGIILKGAVELFKNLMSQPTIVTAFCNSPNLLDLVLHACVQLRCLVLQKSKLTEECALSLQKILHDAYLKSEIQTRKYVTACVRLIGSSNDLDHLLMSVLEEINSVVCPFKEDPVVKLTLNKARLRKISFEDP
jgi:hypothetical protein